MKKRILLVSDVKGWGGWVRAEYIKKYLSDEFYFDIIDAGEFNEWVRRVDTEPFDLYYFLFHTMLQKKTTQRLLNKDESNVITIVTGYPTLKPCFHRGGSRESAKNKFLQLSKKCRAIGSNNIKSLEDLKGIYGGETFYAPRGVDEKIFFPMTTSFKRKNDESKFTVAYVGKPVPQKGLEEFIRPACEDAGVNLIINDRNYEDALSPQAMNEFYNEADAYVVASTIDGTPNPALEAASCGKPVISNEIGNMPEFIRDGENGFLLKGDMKVERYANKIKWMKINQKKSFEMGQEARKDIEEKWTWENVVTMNERKIFKELL